MIDIATGVSESTAVTDNIETKVNYLETVSALRVLGRAVEIVGKGAEIGIKTADKTMQAIGIPVGFITSIIGGGLEAWERDDINLKQSIAGNLKEVFTNPTVRRGAGIITIASYRILDHFFVLTPKILAVASAGINALVNAPK